MTDEPEWLTTKEVADKLRVKVSAMHGWRTLGIGPRAFRVGRRLLYDPADVRAWVLSREASDLPGSEPDMAAAVTAGASPARAGG